LIISLLPAGRHLYAMMRRQRHYARGASYASCAFSLRRREHAVIEPPIEAITRHFILLLRH
jgi:hypothetical protein